MDGIERIEVVGGLCIFKIVLVVVPIKGDLQKLRVDLIAEWIGGLCLCDIFPGEMRLLLILLRKMGQTGLIQKEEERSGGDIFQEKLWMLGSLFILYLRDLLVLS